MWSRFLARANGRTDEGVLRGPRGPKKHHEWCSKCCYKQTNRPDNSRSWIYLWPCLSPWPWPILTNTNNMWCKGSLSTLQWKKLLFSLTIQNCIKFNSPFQNWVWNRWKQVWCPVIPCTELFTMFAFLSQSSEKGKLLWIKYVEAYKKLDILEAHWNLPVLVKWSLNLI